MGIMKFITALILSVGTLTVTVHADTVLKAKVVRPPVARVTVLPPPGTVMAPQSAGQFFVPGAVQTPVFRNPPTNPTYMPMAPPGYYPPPQPAQNDNTGAAMAQAL